MHSGYYSMQCICGWWHPSNLKPQSQWTDDDCKEQVKHQQFHLHQQALQPDYRDPGQGVKEPNDV